MLIAVSSAVYKHRIECVESIEKKILALKIQVSLLTDKFLIYSIIFFTSSMNVLGSKLTAGTDVSTVRFHYPHF